MWHPRYLVYALLPLGVATFVTASHARTPKPGSGSLYWQRVQRPIVVEQLSPDAYWVQHVGFAAFVVGDKGVIAFDTGGSPAVGKEIVDAITKVTPKPVNTLILSHGDADHVAGISAFPAGITIIAQQETKKMLDAASASSETGPEIVHIPADHPINRTVAKREDVVIDGVAMQLLHWAPAHTSGDLVVYLPKEKLVFVGDVLVMDQHNLPLIHMDKGGTSRGWIETVKGMLALDATRYVIGHEGVGGKDVLEQQLKVAVAERDKVKQLYDQGQSLQAIETAVGDPPPVAPGAPPSVHHFPPYSEVLYTELKAGTF